MPKESARAARGRFLTRCRRRKRESCQPSIRRHHTPAPVRGKGAPRASKPSDETKKLRTRSAPPAGQKHQTGGCARAHAAERRGDETETTRKPRWEPEWRAAMSRTQQWNSRGLCTAKCWKDSGGSFSLLWIIHFARSHLEVALTYCALFAPISNLQESAVSKQRHR